MNSTPRNEKRALQPGKIIHSNTIAIIKTSKNKQNIWRHIEVKH